MKYNLDEVFGVSNQQIETYLFRDDIDTRFIDGLSSDKHIVVYGSSKQGKTSLYRRHLDPKEYIIIECSPSTSTIDINKSILRQIGVTLNSNTIITTEDNSDLKAGLKIALKIPVVGEVGSEIGVGESSKVIKTDSYNTYDYNLSLAQDVTEALKILKFNKKIVIDNFHYLSNHTQSKFAFDLRTYHDTGIQFIILGIWREKNRLLQFNGDLVDRILEIPVEPWTRGDFHKIITNGEALLNIDFYKIRDAIVNDSFESVGVLQELCKESCISAGIKNTVFLKKQLEFTDYSNAITAKVEHYSGRHFRSFETFIEQRNSKSKRNKPLNIPYYFLVILSRMDFIEIQKGIKRKYIHESIKEIHPKPNCIRSADISNFLHNIVKYQINKGINPPLFDYDLSNLTCRIIDSTLFFYLQYFKRENILDYLSNPTEEE